MELTSILLWLRDHSGPLMMFAFLLIVSLTAALVCWDVFG